MHVLSPSHPLFRGFTCVNVVRILPRRPTDPSQTTLPAFETWFSKRHRIKPFSLCDLANCKQEAIPQFDEPGFAIPIKSTGSPTGGRLPVPFRPKFVTLQSGTNWLVSIISEVHTLHLCTWWARYESKRGHEELPWGFPRYHNTQTPHAHAIPHGTSTHVPITQLTGTINTLASYWLPNPQLNWDSSGLL